MAYKFVFKPFVTIPVAPIITGMIIHLMFHIRCISIHKYIIIIISGDRDVVKKEAEIYFKYKDFTTQIQCMCNVNTKVIPVTIRPTEPSQHQSQNTSATKHDIKELKSAILGTAHLAQ